MLYDSDGSNITLRKVFTHRTIKICITDKNNKTDTRELELQYEQHKSCHCIKTVKDYVKETSDDIGDPPPQLSAHITNKDGCVIPNAASTNLRACWPFLMLLLVLSWQVRCTEKGN